MASRKILFFILLSVFSVGAYLFVSWLTYRIGFPLDDAWIHLTYARNLAVRGEWAFIPGQPSAGSTSPLWSGLLGLGFYLPYSPYLWVYLLGTVTLAVLAITGYVGFGLLWHRENDYWALFAGVLLILEWHLVWSAVSGMETLLFSLLVLLSLVLIAAQWNHWGALGVLIGVSVWLRPDGLTLIFPALLLLGLAHLPYKKLLHSILRFGLGFHQHGCTIPSVQ